ncbi:MAG: 4Fe-4S binding protein [Acidobacteriota bacterium]
MAATSSPASRHVLAPDNNFSILQASRPATPSRHDHGATGVAMWLRRVGIALVLIGLAVFLYIGVAGDYRISQEALDALAADGLIQEQHQAILFEELAPLVDRTYDGVGPFLDDVERKLLESNERLDGGSQIWEYNRGQYQLYLAKAAGQGPAHRSALLFFFLSFGLVTLGALLDFLPRIVQAPGGIKNHGIFHSGLKTRGMLGIAFGVFLIGFYVLIYFMPAYVAGWIRLVDPLSVALRGKVADQWFFYGTIYTFCVVVMGVRMLVNYRHNRYHMVRTWSVMFFQLIFAWLIPGIMAAINQPEVDFKFIWPLDYNAFADYKLASYIESGAFGWFLLAWAIGLVVIAVPVLTYLYGKRWYCSWVCGCGGLAETLGDPFRHQSDKSLRAWQVERWLIHAVLVFAVVMTGIVVADFLVTRSGGNALLGGNAWKVRNTYGFLIGSIFAGVVGTGFYPFMGNRVWCRFGCPLAAMLGMVQKFKSRFRITTNGGQCISCGNCSTYCEMGIDVRWYAQRGQNIIRSSCVGCGVCAAVCPRGVLRLENGPEPGRYNEVSLVQIGRGRIDVS